MDRHGRDTYAGINRHTRTDKQKLCRIIFTVHRMCRGEQTESSASGMVVPDKAEVAISVDGQGSCLVPTNPGQGGMLQVDDVICLHHTADQGGTVEQCTGMAGVSGPGQKGPWRQGQTLARRGDNGARMPGGDQGV